jgi:hypothetical protein
MLEWFELNLNKGGVQINTQINDFEENCSFHQPNVGTILILGIEYMQMREALVSHKPLREQ